MHNFFFQRLAECDSTQNKTAMYDKGYCCFLDDEDGPSLFRPLNETWLQEGWKKEKKRFRAVSVTVDDQNYHHCLAKKNKTENFSQSGPLCTSGNIPVEFPIPVWVRAFVCVSPCRTFFSHPGKDAKRHKFNQFNVNVSVISLSGKKKKQHQQNRNARVGDPAGSHFYVYVFLFCFFLHWNQGMMGCRTSGGESRLLALLVAEAAGGDDVASGGQLKRIRSVSNMHTHTQTHTH